MKGEKEEMSRGGYHWGFCASELRVGYESEISLPLTFLPCCHCPHLGLSVTSSISTLLSLLST